MKTYELTCIISSQYSANEADNTINQALSAIKNKGGIVLKSEKTSPQMLSYPIKGQHSGYFINLEFQVEEDKIKEILEITKDKSIIRSAIVVKKPVKPLKTARKPMFTAKRPLFSIDSKEVKTDNSDVKIDTKEIEKKLEEILGQ